MREGATKLAVRKSGGTHSRRSTESTSQEPRVEIATVQGLSSHSAAAALAARKHAPCRLITRTMSQAASKSQAENSACEREYEAKGQQV